MVYKAYEWTGDGLRGFIKDKKGALNGLCFYFDPRTPGIPGNRTQVSMPPFF